MDKRKAFLFQQQIKQNNDDLQREFLDMQTWEEQMKKKDFEIRNSKNDQELPPVRTKKKKVTTPSTEETKGEKPCKSQRIGSYDYGAWDKFDEKKACNEIDGVGNKKKKNEKPVFEIPSAKQLEEEHAEATKLKEEGNVLVQNKEYAKAIGKYSQAIKIFPGDAAFFVNRALCQIKIDNLYSAESDCTDAIKLNGKYVKAYYRRATARIELKRYNDAKKDLEIVLELEPSNKEAASMLAQVEKRIESSAKTLIISDEEKNDNSSIEKKIGNKLFKKISGDTLENKKLSTKEKSEGDIFEDDPIKIDIKMNEKESLYEEMMRNEEAQQKKIVHEKKSGLPSWLPKLKENITFVKTTTEALGRKKQLLKRIPVKEISANESIFKEIQDIEENEIENSIEIKENVTESTNDLKHENENLQEKSEIKNDEEEVESFPPPPKSSVSFLITWRKNKSLDFRYKYLKQIMPKDIPDIFKESMESNIFSDILNILNTKFISDDDKVYDYLSYLSKLKRFRALILFMSSSDKEALKNLIEICKSKEERSDEEIKNLLSAYEM